MSETQLDFVPIDDGEPPSPGVDRTNYQTGEVYEHSFSEHMSIMALTANAEQVIANAHILTGDSYHDGHVEVIKGNVRLLRKVVSASGRDEDGEIFEKNTMLYFYIEQLQNGEYIHQSWNSGSDGFNMPHDDHDTISAAADITSRLERAFTAPEQTLPKRRFGSALLRRIIAPSEHA